MPSSFTVIYSFPLSKIICTIHWLPITKTSVSSISDIKGFIQYILLKMLSWKIQFFVVHTEECYSYFMRLGIKSILVGYPLDVDQIKLKDNLQQTSLYKKRVENQERKILFVGDIRFDKGIKLVSELIPYLPIDWNITVAGNTKTLPRKFDGYLKSLAHSCNQFIYKPGFIPDEELISLISESDVILLPYNLSHRGASGILGLAALTETPVIASKNHNISEIVNKYSLGLVADLSIQSFSIALKSILDYSYCHSPNTSQFYRDHSPDIYLKTIINSI